MNETIKNLLERRSVRCYKEDLVPEEVLNEILEAGEYAPSGMGQQGTLMVVTQNPELVAKLSKMNADVMGTESDPFYGAPTVVVVFADSNMPTCVENGSLVMGNLMNAAHARVEMEAQGSRELLAQMVEMLGRQRFIEIEGIEERVIPVEVESGFYSR